MTKLDQAQNLLDDINHPTKATIPRDAVLKILQLLIDDAKDDSKIRRLVRREAGTAKRGTRMNRRVRNVGS